MRVAHVSVVDMTPRFLLLPLFERLIHAGFEVTSISADGPWSHELQARGVRHIPWPGATRSWDLKSDVAALASLVGILRRERFDIVHTHTPKAGVLGRVAARLTGVPGVVNTVHGLYVTPQDHWVRKSAVLGAEAVASRFSDAELYQSAEDLRWAMSRRVVPLGKAELVTGGVDLDTFDPKAANGRLVRQEVGIPFDAVVVGTLGRMVVEKGVRELLSAARQIPEAIFLVVGEPDYSRRDAISKKEIEQAPGNVVFTGWRSDARDLLAAMDVFVLASWREGMPQSVMEAAAMAKPLVVTDIRGSREIVRDGVEGIVVPSRDPESLGAAVKRLVGDPELRASMGAAAQDRCRKLFDLDQDAAQVIRCYRRLVFTGEAGGEPAIRSAQLPDAKRLAQLHASSLPDAFLPALGASFLLRLYRALIVDASSVVVVADDGTGAVGFAAGVISVRDFYKQFLLRRGISAALHAAPRLLDPRVIIGIWETARYPSGNGGLPDAELLAIAVAPEHRGRGLGGKLTRHVLDGLSERGAKSAKVVVGASNLDANRFYEQAGFRPHGPVTVHQGTPSNVLVARWTS